MGSSKPRNRSKTQKLEKHLAPKKTTKAKKKQKNKILANDDNIIQESKPEVASNQLTAADQVEYFFQKYQSAKNVHLSSLELDSIKDKCIVENFETAGTNVNKSLGERVKRVFGQSWKEVLSGKQLREGEIEPGNPALIVVSLSAMRSLELLREMRSLTKECHAAKLFSKHMKRSRCLF